ncbi:MAG: DUF4157 domain-containing protein [Chitinophagaceae bacterium]|nr:DUF4157 domain-containing protein [Chitinophagaceae bacterium]
MSYEFSQSLTPAGASRAVANNMPPAGSKFKANNTGIPDDIKSGVESLSGYSMDDVKVHYNSDRPAQLRAFAYTQGTDIHIAPGQEQHLPHEAWHVVQQKQGRVQTTFQMKAGIAINDDEGLEREADEMGQQMLQMKQVASHQLAPAIGSPASTVIQRKLGFEFETGYTISRNEEPLTKKAPIGTVNGTGWKAESDDDGRLEFIVYPPLEINASLEAKINTIFTAIETYCKGIEDRAKIAREEVVEEPVDKDKVFMEEFAPEPDEPSGAVEEDSGAVEEDSSKEDSPEKEYTYKAFSLELVTNAADDRNYSVMPSQSGYEVNANPQVTTGLSLDQLYNLNEETLKGSPAEKAIQSAAGKIALIRPRIPSSLSEFGLDKAPSDQLKGLLALVVSYLVGGNQKVPLSYPKELTDTFVLSRTGVNHLIFELPFYEKVFFQKNPSNFVALALHTANMTGAGDARLITPGLQPPGKDQRAFGPTRKAWLNGIVTGSDLLSKAADEEYESMGELGKKTEFVGTKDGDTFISAGIFEIRAGQTMAQHYKTWRKYALDLAKYIKTFQKDTAGFLRDDKIRFGKIDKK